MTRLPRHTSPHRRALSGALLAVVCLAAAPVWAAARSFIARADRTEVPLDDSFIFEVTLVLDGGTAVGYRPPDFKNFRVLSERPSQSHQFRMGAGGTFQQTVYTWTYELEPAEMGTFTIGPARVKVGGADTSTGPVNIRVSAATGAQRRAAPPRSGLSVSPLGVQRPAPAAAPSGGRNFVRAVPSAQTVYVGEQITVEWLLYLSERQNRFQTIREPQTDGFWAEDLPNPDVPPTMQDYQGSVYSVSPLFKKALFPLRPGKLTITPFEAEISQVDFFGTMLRTERLKTEPLTIEVLPLPAAGQPAGFDGAAVGRLAIEASVDRNRVAVGEAVTLMVTLSGEGNVRKLPVPELDTRKLVGWKLYEPKITVDVTPGTPVVGRKRVEYLLLPEKPGTTKLDPFRLSYFDPVERSYKHTESAALEIEVTAEPGVPNASTAGTGAAPAALPRGAASDNVLGPELRPIRARGGLGRDLGTTLYRSPAFVYLLAVPPLLLFGAFVVGRVRAQLGRETERGKSRRVKRLLRQRLGRAEEHLRAGQSAAFFIEIDKALRDVLAARLGSPVTGLSRDELRALLERDGMPADLCDEIIATLERCDQARFAPGGVGDEEMSHTLEVTDDLLGRIDRLRKNVERSRGGDA